jgi:hypothetical protein
MGDIIFLHQHKQIGKQLWDMSDDELMAILLEE